MATKPSVIRGHATIYTEINLSLWPSGININLGRNRLRVRFLAVSDIYPIFIEPTITYLGPLRVLWLHMARYKNCVEKKIKKQSIVWILCIVVFPGADWRTLANRVGIEPEKLEEWSALRLKNPAGRVLTTWVDACPAATVRLLHRHLMSPPMRCTLLCKRLSDFYSVN